MSRILDKKKITGFYINDSSDEVIDLDDKKLNGLKTVNDSYNKKNENYTNDSSRKINPDLDFYIVDTVSDKEINSRTYDSVSIENSVGDRGWVFPYNRPVITNHNVGGGWFGGDANVLGRVTDSFFISHDKCKVTKKSKRDSNLPDLVLQDVLNNVTGGTATSVVKVNLNTSAIDRLLDGRMVSFSQGSIYYNATCNICGKDYRSSDCGHYIGESYSLVQEDGSTKQVTCVPKMFDREPVEISEVLSPANDTSKIMIYNRKEKRLLDLLSLSENDLFSLVEQTQQSDSKGTTQVDNKVKVPSVNFEQNNNANFNNDSKSVKVDINKQREVQKVELDKKDELLAKMAKKNAINDLKKVLSSDKVSEVKTILNEADFETSLILTDFISVVFEDFSKDKISDSLKKEIKDSLVEDVKETSTDDKKPLNVLPNVKNDNKKEFKDMSRDELLDFVLNKQKENEEDSNEAFANEEKDTKKTKDNKKTKEEFYREQININL